MITYAEALAILRRAAERRGRLPAETVALADAEGRVSAGTVLAAEPLPRFDNSSMDGYAVAAARTAGASPAAPVVLPVVGSIAAGDPPACAPRPGAWEIMTGAPLPAGCDAVVRVEDAEPRDGGRSVELRAAAEAGDYVRRAGQDFEAGAPVLEPGIELGSEALLALAALGVDKAPVAARPRVAVLSTGRELVAPGCPPGPGQVVDASSAYLRSALPALGAAASFHGNVADDPSDFRRRLGRILETRPDVVLTTGAVSMGRYDFIAEELRTLGAETLYHKVAIRPGKPGLVARFPQGTVLFGLPGNPVSTVVGLRFFVAPFLRALLGLPPEEPAGAVLVEGVEKPAGLRCFFKAVVAAGADGLRARALPGQASFQVRPLLQANAWLVLPEAGDSAPRGAVVPVYPLLPARRPWAAVAAVAA